jgi:hypothetical protein
MKYSDGREARLGDRVRLGSDGGIVVCSMDTDEYTEENPKAQWGYLKRGVMIEFRALGLVHYEEPYNGLELVARSSTG